MLLAEAEAYFSRPIAPTRRVALGRLLLPCDPAPGYAGILLGAIAARFTADLDEEWHDNALVLMSQIERGMRIVQPRMRHRLQDDRVGLRPCSHRLLTSDGTLDFDFAVDRGTPAQHTLSAIYAAGTVPWSARAAVMDAVRKGLRWYGPIGPPLIAHLSGRTSSFALSSEAIGDPVAWALGVLDLRDGKADAIDAKQVQRAFRSQLRDAHPDHGATDDGAAQRIAELTEARRILLG
jgi:hypothetical protein